MKRWNRFVRLACAIVLILLGSVLWKVYTFQHERAEAQAKLANINAQSTLETRSVKVDESGQTHHTLCAGNWCVTDRVPPESFGKTDWHQVSRKVGSGFPIIDLDAVERAIEDQKGRSRGQTK